MATASEHTTKPNPVRARMNRDGFFQRRGMKMILWTILPLVIGLGFIWPIIGLSLLLCMAGAIGVSFWRGRAWCDVCPRGAFLDIVMKPISGKRPIPKLLKATATRIVVLCFVMGMMAFRLSHVWGDASQMGMVFVQLLSITSIVGVVLALRYNPRSWCMICPMGSMATWIGKKKHPLQLSNDLCISCNACHKACPMELNPEAHREQGQMCAGDCLKCSACVVACPKQALSFY
jgi:polyferredoxin